MFHSGKLMRLEDINIINIITSDINIITSESSNLINILEARCTFNESLEWRVWDNKK